MRQQLNDRQATVDAMAEVNAPVCEGTLPYEPRIVDDVYHWTNRALVLYLIAIQATPVSVVFVLHCTAWGLVILWSLSRRNGSQPICLRTHNECVANYLPSSETVQVLTLTSFLQLNMAFAMHAFVLTGSYGITIAHGCLVGLAGMVVRSLLKSFIQGSSPSFLAALEVEKIALRAPGWNEDAPEEGDANAGKTRWAVWSSKLVRLCSRRKPPVVHRDVREYAPLYATADERKRRLGELATVDWERAHLEWEEQVGAFDVFEEAAPDKDPTLIAAFLNSNLFGLRGKGAAEKPKAPKLADDLVALPVRVEPLPLGGGRAFLCEALRDALLQWQLRHSTDEKGEQAIDWMLGQLDPDAFETRRVKVPEALRPMLVEALLAHAQRHPTLQLDASFAARLGTTLRQLAPGRFSRVEVSLPGTPDEGAELGKLRHLVHSALLHHLARKGTKGGQTITQEAGWLVQQTLHSLGTFREDPPDDTDDHGLDLLVMPYGPSQADGWASLDPAEQETQLTEEIAKRADAIRAASDEYIADDELFTQVHLLRYTDAPTVEVIEPRRVRRGGRASTATSTAAPPPTATPPSAPPSPPDDARHSAYDARHSAARYSSSSPPPMRHSSTERRLSVEQPSRLSRASTTQRGRPRCWFSGLPGLPRTST